METIEVPTRAACELVEITGKVREAVARSGVAEGLCVVVSPHTTAGILVNEHADPDVARDIIAELARIVPDGDRFQHAEGNSPAHVKTSLVGGSAVLIVEGGALRLGTWQGIFLAEFDGPRRRTVLVQIVGG